jgi:hypothetical protein
MDKFICIWQVSESTSSSYCYTRLPTVQCAMAKRIRSTVIRSVSWPNVLDQLLFQYCSE